MIEAPYTAVVPEGAVVDCATCPGKIAPGEAAVLEHGSWFHKMCHRLGICPA